MAIDPNYPGASSVMKKGREYWRFRKDGKEKSLPGAPGDECFELAYQRLAAGFAPADNVTRLPVKKMPGARSWGDAWRLFRDSKFWADSSELTIEKYILRGEHFLNAQAEELYLLPFMGQPVINATGDRMRAYLKPLEKRSVASARQALTLIRKLAEIAIEEKWITPEQNPVIAITIKKPKSTPSKVWAPHIRDRFEAFHAPGTLARTVYSIAYYLGNRRSDCALLRWDQLETQEFLDEAGDYTEREVFHFNQRKNHKKKDAGKEMNLPVPDGLWEALAPLDRTKSKTIVAKPNGQPYKIVVLSALMRRWAKEADCEGYTLHGLRRTFATTLAMQNMNTVHLMHAMGHSKLETTQQYIDEALRMMAQSGTALRFNTFETKRRAAKQAKLYAVK